MINIAFIGLSKSGGWAATSHLNYLKSELANDYKIIGLLNSSKEASQAAITHYELDPATKTYASADDLAEDDDVDLVICAVKVTSHAAMIKPAVIKGRRCFVEWPLAQNLSEAQELVDLAKAHPSSGLNICSLQDHLDAAYQKIRALIEQGLIGKVLSSNYTGLRMPMSGNVPESFAYCLDKDSGATVIDIPFPHAIRGLTTALGDFEHHTAVIVNAQPETQIVNAASGEVVKTVQKSAPDHIVFSAKLKSGAALSVQVSAGQAWPEQPFIDLRIVGSKGQIKVIAPSAPALEFDESTTIEHYDYATGKVANIEWKRGSRDGPEEAAIAKLPGPARAMARVYQAILKDEVKGSLDWERALEMHGFIDGLHRSFRESM